MISSLKYLLPFFIWIMSIIFNDAVAAFFPYGVFIREFLCSIFAFVILIFNKNKKDIVLFFALIPFSIQSYAFDINNFYIFFSLTIIVSLTIRMIRDKEYIKFKPFNLILCFIPIACLISQLVNCMYTNLWINVSYILLCISYIYLILYFASYIKFNLLTDNIYFIIISITLIGQSLIMNTFYSIVPYCVPILYCLTALMIVSLKTNNPNNRYISYMGIFINFVYCICKMKYYIDFVFLGILLIYLIAYILINKINKKESIAFISSMLLTGLILWSIFSTKTYEMNKYSLTNIKDSFSIF